MMHIPGERFTLPLDSDTRSVQSPPPQTLSFNFIGDIVEKPRSSASAIPPSLPSVSSSTASGFPAHKKRQPRGPSRFQQQRAERQGPPEPPLPENKETYERDVKKQIDAENNAKIAQMSEDAILRERKELLEKLPPGLVERLLKRTEETEENGKEKEVEEKKKRSPPRDPALDMEAMLKKADMGDSEIFGAFTENDYAKPMTPAIEVTEEEACAPAIAINEGPAPAIKNVKLKPSIAKPAKKVAFEDGSDHGPKLKLPKTPLPHMRTHEDAAAASDSSADNSRRNSATDSFDIDNAAPSYEEASRTVIHFPHPATDSDELDPNDPEFLNKLHSKYFPSLPSDPSKLSWMQNVSEEEDRSAYHPSMSSIPASALRFDFRGDVLAPTVAHEVPGHLGLHHHGDAPNAAGYTIPELARLARSSFPSQRCIAMQILGRVLYKLGKGFGGFANEDINKGLWKCVKDGGVLDTIQSDAGEGTQNVSIKAHAMEAVWLWKKGGGQVWKAT